MHNDHSKQLSVNDTVDQFRLAMREQGIETTAEIIPDGKLHRFHVNGDARGSLNGFYCLHYDEKPAGIFGCNKRFGNEHKFNWQANAKVEWSDEDRRAYKERVAKERAQKDAAEKTRLEQVAVEANEIWNAATPADDSHPYLVSKGVKAHGLRVGRWEKVNQESSEIWFTEENALLVPIADRTRKIQSLQAIMPEKSKYLGNRNKDYLSGGAKRGLFHTLGTKPLAHNGVPVFALCEGYATGATIHEDTGHLTLTCFDAGNLPVVAQAIHERMVAMGKPVIILLCADNDRWTLQPVENPGIHHAKNAAKAVGGVLAIPDFKDLSGEPTDFNDLHQREGADAVRAIIDAALNPPAEEEVPWVDEPAPVQPQPLDNPEEPVKADQKQNREPEDEFEGELVSNGHFTILGYDGPTYYLFQHEKRQVMDISKADLSDNGLIELAPLQWWEENFPSEKGVNKKQAANWLFRQANARGIYDPSRVRGRGAWKDKDRYVFHHGDRLTVDGVPMDITRIKSAYVYPMSKRMPEPEENMLTAEEGRHLLEIAKLVRWTKPASAALLAGWTMMAPICGALKWRPHIWLTGAAGSGKSTIQNQFCCALTSGISVYAQGNSTEPGIRQELRADALPVLIDEAESNDEKERSRMDAILAMIRQSSSESQAKTLKGTISGSSMRFSIRSMFCLASVNTNLDKKADVDRLTKLVIRPPSIDGSGEDHWGKLSEELHKIATDDTIANRLLARALVMLPKILQNVEVFTRASAKFFGSQREGDQFGTMMAGAWSLCSDDVATDEQAMKMLNRYDWGEHTEDHDQDDAAKALEALMSSKIRIGMIGDLTIYELIRETSPLHRNDIVPAKEADRVLKQNGIRVEHKEGVVLFGTGISNMKKLVERTSFVTDLRGQLLRLPGATRYNDKPMRFNGLNSKCISIPMAPLLDGDRNDNEPPI